jgi:hypothetical protein
MLRIVNKQFSKHLIVPCLLLTGCLQSTALVSASQPGWVTGESSAYPNAQYVVATGSASNAEQAKNRALANLTKVFELHIRESSTTKQEVESFKQGGSETVSTSQSLSQQINIQTNKIIDGSRVAEQWQNSEDLTHYALAVLDRRQAGNNIRGEINRLDEETSYDLKAAESKPNPLLKVAAYQRVLVLQEERDTLQKMLKVLDLSGRGAESLLNRAELRERLESSLGELNMSPAVLSDAVGGLDKILKGAMAHAGFPEASNQNGYVLSAGLDTQPPINSQGWYWLRGTLTLRLSSADGRVQGNKTWPLKVSASRMEQLDARMKSAVEKKLNQELKPTILGFAASE